MTAVKDGDIESQKKTTWLKRVFRIEWLGQTAASLFWIASVFTYGIDKLGDWLQLFAAVSWLTANVAVIAQPEHEEKTG